ncbi:MAG: PPOX class F420-dependent oxidoreductase [Ktedonobacteraceae bacterium]|nr:PPOX class F420-dependent oxidoreductase [Ktedonobacteraceae bacterium]
MQVDSAFAALGEKAFVSLTTFRKNGERISSPVWVARDGDTLIVLTPEESAKIKRLRNNGQVEIRPSSRTGKVADNSEPIPGIAEIVTDAPIIARLTRVIQKKYGVEYYITMLIERIAARRQKPRVILRITPAALNA